MRASRSPVRIRRWLRVSSTTASTVRSEEHSEERIRQDQGSYPGPADHHAGAGDRQARNRRREDADRSGSRSILKQDRERWNDWGIGMLLQGDLKGAEYAFTRVTEAEPGYADGWLNVARALIQEGETERAKPYHREGAELDTSLRPYPLLQSDDPESGRRLRRRRSPRCRRSIAEYPRDRVALNQIGAHSVPEEGVRRGVERAAAESRGRSGRRAGALHVDARLSWLGRRSEAAAREEKLFRRFKADESSQAITGEAGECSARKTTMSGR